MSRPRIRSLKPERWQEEPVGTVSRDARLLWVVLTTMADDDGRLRGLPSLIIGHGYAYDDDVTPAKIKRWLDELDGVGLVVRYEVDGRPYIWLTDFTTSQHINRPTASQLPPPPITSRSRTGAHRLTEDSVNGTGELTEGSVPRTRACAGADRIGSGSGTTSSSSPLGSDQAGEGEEQASTQPPPQEGVDVEVPPAAQDRRDVARLCQLLAGLMLENNPKAKTAPRTTTWQDPIRLLLDRDGHSEEDVAKVIRWCQADDFWRTNILSPKKLRKQFDQLTLKMQADGVRRAVERAPASSAQIGAALASRTGAQP